MKTFIAILLSVGLACQGYAAAFDWRYQQYDSGGVLRAGNYTVTANTVLFWGADQAPSNITVSGTGDIVRGYHFAGVTANSVTVTANASRVIELVAGSGVALLANNTTKNITISASSSGGGTTNATDLTSGTLPVARLPATTLGTVTSTAGTGNFNVVASGVTAATYGNATTVPRITVLSDGRVSLVENTTITAGTGNVINLATLAGNATVGNIIVGGGTVNVTTSNMTWNATSNTLNVPTIAATTINVTTVNADDLVLGNVISGAAGGTGVANTGKTITLGGNLTTTGAHNTNIITTVSGNYTLPPVDAKLGTAGIIWTVANANVTTNTTHNGQGMIAETLGNNTTTITLNRTQATTDAANGGFTFSVWNVATTNSITVTASSGNIILIGSGNLTGGTSAVVAPGGLATFILGNTTLGVAGSNVTVP